MYKQFNICVNLPDDGKMYIQRINNGKRVPMYHCGNYPKVPVGTLCPSAHRIKADHVMEIVAKTIKGVIQYASIDKERFAEERGEKRQTSPELSETESQRETRGI